MAAVGKMRGKVKWVSMINLPAISWCRRVYFARKAALELVCRLVCEPRQDWPAGRMADNCYDSSPCRKGRNMTHGRNHRHHPPVGGNKPLSG